MDWYLQVLSKYADFSGRATRSEFWWFALYNLLIAIGLAIAEFVLGLGQLLSVIYGVAIFIPNWAVSVRRLHDTDHSGWWLLIGIVPLVGAIILFIFYISDSSPGPNDYGSSPKQSGPSSAAIASFRLEDDLNSLYDQYRSGDLSNEEYQERRRALLSRPRHSY